MRSLFSRNRLCVCMCGRLLQYTIQRQELLITFGGKIKWQGKLTPVYLLLFQLYWHEEGKHNLLTLPSMLKQTAQIWLKEMNLSCIGGSLLPNREKRSGGERGGRLNYTGVEAWQRVASFLASRQLASRATPQNCGPVEGIYVPSHKDITFLKLILLCEGYVMVVQPGRTMGLVLC